MYLAKTTANFLVEEQLEKLREEEKETELATDRRSKYGDLGFDFGERKRGACFLPYSSLGLGNNKENMPRKSDKILAFYITSMRRAQKISSFPYLFFHFERPPNLRLTFDVSKRNKFGGRVLKK